MKKSNWSGRKEEEEYPAALYQRTEELYQTPTSELDGEGFIELPAIIFDENIVFPRMVSPIFVSNKKNLAALKEAQSTQKTVVTLISREPGVEKSKIRDFLQIGVEVATGRLLTLSEGNYSALVQGRRRVQIMKIIKTDPLYIVKAVPIFESIELGRKTNALMRATRDLFERCVHLDRSLPDEAQLLSMNINEPGWLTDMVATAISLTHKERQELLVLTDPIERLKKLNWLLAQELDVLQLEDDIQSQVQSEVDHSQREFYLREQLKAIQTELGEGDIWIREINELKGLIEKAGLPVEVKTQALKEVDRLIQMPSMAPEVGVIRNYLDWILELPWVNKTEDNLDVKHARKILEKYHYGLGKAKDRILEYIAVRSLKPQKPRQPILCFVGPPGTGKTSLGKSIAEALNRKFVRLSLGGVRDEAEIRGHRRTYIGALPGRILQTMRRAGTINPLFMLDEIDKLGSDFRGDPSAALLEVLDPEQNHSFSDHYLELPYDLSQVMFITTANQTMTIPSALMDRMEVIEFPGYIEEEKFKIAERFLIPRQKEESGIDDKELSFEASAVIRVIREYTYEAGVRNLERELGRIIRKTARLKSEGKKFPEVIHPKQVERFLGPAQYFQTEAEKKDEIGVATAVAWTESGGEIMPVEVLVFDGKGTLQVTGQIGDVMQESAQAALSYLKSKAKEFNIKEDLFERVDIHIHIPEGAIPKDGPSAGITLAIALISAFTGRKVYKDMGMTGEITLRGQVLPVGGIREKVLAAHRAGLKRVILPTRNLKDLIDVPKKALADINIIPVDHMDQIVKEALHPYDPKNNPPFQLVEQIKKENKDKSVSSPDKS